MLRKQAKQKVRFDGKAKDLTPLEEGQVVRMKPFITQEKIWRKGRVIQRLDEGSYDEETANGNVRWNHVHLKPTAERPSWYVAKPSIPETPGPVRTETTGIMVSPGKPEQTLDKDRFYTDRDATDYSTVDKTTPELPAATDKRVNSARSSERSPQRVVTRSGREVKAPNKTVQLVFLLKLKYQS